MRSWMGSSHLYHIRLSSCLFFPAHWSEKRYSTRTIKHKLSTHTDKPTMKSPVMDLWCSLCLKQTWLWDLVNDTFAYFLWVEVCSSMYSPADNLDLTGTTYQPTARGTRSVLKQNRIWSIDLAVHSRTLALACQDKIWLKPQKYQQNICLLHKIHMLIVTLCILLSLDMWPDDFGEHSNCTFRFN